jgi:CHAT domain-containing protein/uncharacterized glyoxalase superfamily protein PhnB
MTSMTNARWKHGRAVAGFVLAVQGVGLAVLQAQARAATPTAVERVMPRLVVGHEKTATIEGNEQQIYNIPMEKGQYLELIVKQKTVDAIATLFNPQGKQVLEASYTGRGEELVVAVAEQTGNYRLLVRRNEQDAIRGDYGVQVVAVRSASQSDKSKASAYQSGSQALAEGLEMLKVGQPASSQQALTKFKTALGYFKSSGNTFTEIEVVALQYVGDSYAQLKEYKKALDAYFEALTEPGKVVKELLSSSSLFSVEDAYSLQRIGAIQYAQQKNDKAVESFTLSFKNWQKTPERLSDLRKLLLQIAIVYREVEEYAKEIEALKIVQALDRKLEDKRSGGLTSFLLGMSYGYLNRYAEATDAFEQSLRLYKKVGLRTEQGVVLDALAGIYHRQGLHEEAEKYKRRALTIANRNKKAEIPPASETQKLLDQGMFLLSQGTAGSQAKAIQKWERTLPFFVKKGNELRIAQKLLNEGKKLYNQGSRSYILAIDKLEAALPLWNDLRDKSKEAQINELLGVMYAVLENRPKAIKYYSQALLLYQETRNQTKEVRMHSELGRSYFEAQQLNKALEYYQKALLISKSFGQKSGYARRLGTVAGIYSTLGEKQKALDAYQKTLLIWRAEGSPYEVASSLNSIGLIYVELGAHQKAIEFFQQALPLSQRGKKDHHGLDRGRDEEALFDSDPILKQMGEETRRLEDKNDRLMKARTLNGIGRFYSGLGKNQKALDYYQQALLLSREMGGSGESRYLNNVGVAFFALGENQKALDYYQQSLRLSKENGSRGLEAYTLTNMGFFYYTIGDNQKALGYYQGAMPLFSRAVDRSGEATLFYKIAQLEQSRGNQQAALKPIQESIAIVEELRTKLIDPDLRQSYFATVQKRYQFYIELLMELHQQNPSQGYDKQAFNISERSRARTLLELLAEANANIKEGIDPQLLTEEKTLQGQLDATEKQRLEIYETPESSAVEKAAIVKLQRDLLAQYQTLQNEIRAKSPKFAALKYPQPLTLVQVQKQLLDSDTTLLQYSLGKEKSFLWVVSRDGLQSHVLPPEKEIESQVKSWRSALLDKPEVPETLDGPASRLGRLLLEPAAAALKSRRRVIVVPDGALTYAPFAALRLEGKPLVESHTLLQLPSSSTLALIRSQTAQRLPAPRGLAMVADPIFSGDDPRITTPARTSQPAPTVLASLNLQRASRALPRQRSAGSGAADALPRLPGTRREAERILPLFPGNQSLLALDSQASMALLQSPSIKDYRYVHLATHGVFNTAEPALSGVILSLVDQQGRAVNGFLRLNEIFNLNLPAELVVLSACETGLGEQIRGEGMVGLTRGFLYAGSRRLLVSLWKVDDDATAALMSRFYEGLLREKLTPAQALRAAQNHLRTNTNWDSPYFWSGFVLQGEW